MIYPEMILSNYGSDLTITFVFSYQYFDFRLLDLDLQEILSTLILIELRRSEPLHGAFKNAFS